MSKKINRDNKANKGKGPAKRSGLPPQKEEEAKKMTAEELNEILRKEGQLDERLSIFPDDKYNAFLGMRIAQAVLEEETDD
jgi:hypothetical protein